PVGPVVPGTDAESIRRAVTQLDAAVLAEYADAARSARTIFHWQAQESVLLDVYARLAGAIRGDQTP
ncbi:hypothetical protein, partial [Xylella fastidiosa]|uniref:hypothetical protein n=1 Tax=Xylella fastidiosa TaxID=2371 RepID=UPI001EEBAA2B